MNRKQEILRRLREAGDYVSGQELCETLQVSRTAVWKNIQKLKEEGYPIEAVTNKGYRLLSIEEADIFDREQIAAKLKTEWAGRPLVYKDETGSTNDDVFALAAEGYPHGTLVVASRQSAGKGRRGRTWISPRDGNIYMSILLKPDLPPDVTPMLTVVMALSVYQASVDLTGADSTASVDEAQPCVGSAGSVEAQPSVGSADSVKAQPCVGSAGSVDEAQPCVGSTGSVEAQPSGSEEYEGSVGSAGSLDDYADSADRIRFGIKWPNDIVVSVEGGPFRKLCGILTEMRMEDREISAITIGIGLNVNQTSLSPEIALNATSYSLAFGKKINRAALTASVWNHFETNYTLFAQTQDFSKLHDAYEQGLVNKGRAVHVLDPRDPFEGTAVGINMQGELLVQPDDGSAVRTIASGEVSVRGVNGYV